MGEPGVATDLPAGLGAFVEAAVTTLGPTLRSVVLFGSAADGRMRATSDVNLMLVLRAFDAARIDQLREPLQLAITGMRLAPMFVLESELEAAQTAFAMKFMDIGHRHRVLHGDDPFAAIEVPRAAAITRLRQVLLNLLLRLRERYASQSLNEARFALLLAEFAGPLRAAAATLLTLEGDATPPPPREALELVARAESGDGITPTLALLSHVRQTGEVTPGTTRDAALALLDLIPRMLARASRLG